MKKYFLLILIFFFSSGQFLSQSKSVVKTLGAATAGVAVTTLLGLLIKEDGYWYSLFAAPIAGAMLYANLTIPDFRQDKITPSQLLNYKPTQSISGIYNYQRISINIDIIKISF